MKLLIICLVAAVAFATSTFADALHTNVLNFGDPALKIDVPDDHIVTVINYLGSGNGDSNLSVTKDGKSTVIRYPTDISILNPTPLNLIIAGPATVTITSGSTLPGNVVVTYRVGPNNHNSATRAD